MKKFCSTCGNQLELSQRFCSQCGAVNPFFVSTFSFLSDQSDELEKLRLEKERIDKELAEKEEQQAEFKRQEQLRREAEEAERVKAENQEKERLHREQQERERIEQTLKVELLKVKEETELYKKETTELVQEVKEELQQIEADNRRLKEEVANLSKTSRLVTEVTSTEAVSRPSSTSKMRGFIVSLVIILLALTSALAFFYFNARYEEAPAEDTPLEATTPQLKSAAPEPISVDTVAISENSSVVNDTTTVKTEDRPVNTVPTKESSSLPPAEQAHAEFILTVSKIKQDLVGKRISGCDIMIAASSQIESVKNLSMVEKLGSGNLKYKFTASIVQGDDSYTATPYIYYTPDGTLIKIDGTNCE